MTFTPIPPVLSDTSIPDGSRCQEASILSRGTYLPCSQPAVAIVYHDKDNRSYYMCLPCADHNLHNRGGVLRYTTNQKLKERYVNCY